MTNRLLFCNIGWMARYEGLARKADRIVGGGKHVNMHEHGNEVCNFLAAKNGRVYGYVDRSKSSTELSIDLSRLGGSERVDYVSAIDVVWTATHPAERGRRVVGWYRNATVYRHHQELPKPRSLQHKRDKLDRFRISALARDSYLLDEKDRTLRLENGWFGQANCWFADEKITPEKAEFLNTVRSLIASSGVPSKSNAIGSRNKQGSANTNSPGSPSDPYIRYVESYEVKVTAEHGRLQQTFARYVKRSGATEIKPDIDYVDLRYNDQEDRLVFAEIKPCDQNNARFAIRTAMGQLLDYSQRYNGSTRLLIVLQTKPKDEDVQLATSNGFGVAFPTKNKAFNFFWPKGLS